MDDVDTLVRHTWICRALCSNCHLLAASFEVVPGSTKEGNLHNLADRDDMCENCFRHTEGIKQSSVLTSLNACFDIFDSSVSPKYSRIL